MDFSKKDRKHITILCTACAIGLAFLFPPYITKWKGTIVDAGYGFIFDLPLNGRAYPTVNIPTLLVEILVILIIGGLIYFIFRGKVALHSASKDHPKKTNFDFTSNHKEKENTVDINDNTAGNEDDILNSEENNVVKKSIAYPFMLVVGCLFHIVFCAEGVIHYNWKIVESQPDFYSLLPKILAGTTGYAIPGIVLSILIFVPIGHWIAGYPGKLVFRKLPPYTWAVFIGLGFRFFG